MLTTKNLKASSKARKFANPVCAFRPSDEVLRLLEKAEQITKRTKTSIFTECLEVGLPRFIAANKPQSRLRVNTVLRKSGKA